MLSIKVPRTQLSNNQFRLVDQPGRRIQPSRGHRRAPRSAAAPARSRGHLPNVSGAEAAETNRECAGCNTESKITVRHPNEYNVLICISFL